MTAQWTTADMPEPARPDRADYRRQSRPRSGNRAGFERRRCGCDRRLSRRGQGAKPRVARLQAHAPRGRIAALSVDMAQPESIRQLRSWGWKQQLAKLDLLIHQRRRHHGAADTYGRRP